MKKKQNDTQTKKKKQLVNASRIIASPSPIKNSIHVTSNSVQQEEEQDKKIVIRQSELVSFTKKFAQEKADYEDKIVQLQRENQMLKRRLSEYDSHNSNNSNLKIQFDLSRSKQMQTHPHHSNQGNISSLQSENIHLRNNLNEANIIIQSQKDHNQFVLQQLKTQKMSIINRLQQKNNQCLMRQTEITDLKSQLDKASNLYSKIKTQVSQLRVAQLQKVRESFSDKSVIDHSDRIKDLEADVARLRNLNQLFRTQLKNEDIEIKEKNQLIQELQNQIIILQMQLEKYSNNDCEYFRSRVDSLELERQHLQNQIFLEKANNKRLVELEYKYSELKQQVANKNQAIVELTSEIDNDVSSTNKMLVSKCNQLQTHIERLNKIIIQLNTNSQVKSNDKHNFSQLEEYKRKYSEMLESMKNLQNQSEDTQKFPPLDDLMNQLQENPSRIKLMQNIISGLRNQNHQLKSMIGSDSNYLGVNAQNQLRDIIYQMTRNKLEKQEENQTLRFKVEELRYEIEKHKSNQSFSQTPQTFRQSLSESKKTRLQTLLKKVAEFSKSIILPGEENSFEGDLYELIIGRLIDHISNLESQSKIQYYSYSLDN